MRQRATLETRPEKVVPALEELTRECRTHASEALGAAAGTLAHRVVSSAASPVRRGDNLSPESLDDFAARLQRKNAVKSVAAFGAPEFDAVAAQQAAGELKEFADAARAEGRSFETGARLLQAQKGYRSHIESGYR